MSEHGERTDEELARRAKRGDAEAFDALVRRHLRPALALAWQFMRSLEDAEDVVQEAFHRAVRGLDGYDDGRPFGAWFYAIVRNVGRNATGKAGRRAALVPLTVVSDEPPAPAAPDPVAAGDLERALEALPPMQQATFRLCGVEGFTSGEAATLLGIEEGTVRTHLHRARHALRAWLGPARGRVQG